MGGMIKYCSYFWRHAFGKHPYTQSKKKQNEIRFWPSGKVTFKMIAIRLSKMFPCRNVSREHAHLHACAQKSYAATPNANKSAHARLQLHHYHARVYASARIKPVGDAQKRLPNVSGVAGWLKGLESRRIHICKKESPQQNCGCFC